MYLFFTKYLDVNNTVGMINMLIYSFNWSLLNYFNIIMLVLGASRISQRRAPTFKGSTNPKGSINLLLRPNFQKTTWKWRKLNVDTGRRPIFQHSRQNPVTLLVKNWNFYISPFFSFFHNRNVVINLCNLKLPGQISPPCLQHICIGSDSSLLKLGQTRHHNWKKNASGCGWQGGLFFLLDLEWIYGTGRTISSGGFRGPLRPKMLSISCSFSQNLAKSYVGAPSYGESWIRPWLSSFFFHFHGVFAK